MDLIGTDRTIDDPLTYFAQAQGYPPVDLGAYEYFPDCDGNSIRDDCDVSCDPPDCSDVPGCGQGDPDFDGTPDACECTDAADCADLDGDGISDDKCLWFACSYLEPYVIDACYSEDRIFADAGGSFEACEPDGFCNIHDANHALNCFNGTNTCDPVNIDIGGNFGACEPDGYCNIHDANHALACFQGTNTCSCPLCPGGATAAMQGTQTVGTGELIAAPVPSLSAANVMRVRVFLKDPLQDLRGYQLDVVVSGGTTGQLELIDIAIEPREDFVFAARDDRFEAFNVTTGQMLCGLEIDHGVQTSAQGCLATYTYRGPPTAAGDFVIDFRHDESGGDQTFLIASHNGRIEVGGTTPGVIATPGQTP